MLAGGKPSLTNAKVKNTMTYIKGLWDAGAITPGIYGAKEAKAQDEAAKSADAQSNANASDVTVRDTNKANAEAPKYQSSVSPGGTTNNAGQAADDVASKATDAKNSDGTSNYYKNV
jgi:hypothetical protein